jgi:ribonuclease VapC
MIIGTSALLAIFLSEPEREPFLQSILTAEEPKISAATVLETGIVLEAKRGETAGRELDLFLVRLNLKIVSVDSEQSEIGRSAWRKYGKGRHPAALNFGDCFAYALAKSLSEPLLAKGADFSATDIELITWRDGEMIRTGTTNLP